MDSFFFLSNFLCKNNVPKESDLILIKLALFQFDKEPMLSELVKNPVYGLYIWMNCLFSINQEVFQIHNNKIIKLFNKNLINIALKIGRNIRESKKHYLVPEITIFGTKSSLTFVAFSNSHPIIDTGQV